MSKKILLVSLISMGLIGCNNHITDPGITDPEITDPEITDPGITAPEITDPEITDPEITDPEITDPDVESVNLFGYTKEILLAELPALHPDTVLEESLTIYAQEPLTSYNNASVKTNDAGSTKKNDLIRFYDEIRHASTENVFREFDGSDFVYREAPAWEPLQKIGVFSQSYAENTLDYYNFMRSLFGAQRVYMSGYKQVAAQASSSSGLGGVHYPTQEMADALGLSDELFAVARHGRESSNLQGGSVDKNADYEAMTTLPRNSSLTSIWNEGEWDNIAGLAHRNSFMFAPGRDVGIGLVNGLHTWLSWGEGAGTNDGSGLGADTQTKIYNSYPHGPTPEGVTMHPSHGYFPFFALSGNNQSVSVKPGGGHVSGKVIGETVTLKMDYYIHDEDGDLTTLENPYETLTLSDVVGTNMNTGGNSPGSAGNDWVPPCKSDTESCNSEYQSRGGYHFTTGHGTMPLVFRMPYGWFKSIQDNMNDAKLSGVLPKYHTIRYSFSSKKEDGSPGESLLIKKAFYMNPKIGSPLTLQTTFFDINSHR